MIDERGRKAWVKAQKKFTLENEPYVATKSYFIHFESCFLEYKL